MTTYRNDIDALAARHAALANEVATKARELENAGQILEEARAKAKLPVLPNIRVATPCTADWNAMTPIEGDRVRHCGSCAKNVYNLSDMTRDEAEQLILAKEGRLCVRYFQRKDGTILMKDCAVGISKKRRRRLFAAGAAALFAAGGGAAMMTRGSSSEHTMGMISDEHDTIQGGIGPSIEPQQDPIVPMQGQMLAPDVHEIKGGVAPMHDLDRLPVKHLTHKKPKNPGAKK